MTGQDRLAPQPVTRPDCSSISSGKVSMLQYLPSPGINVFS